MTTKRILEIFDEITRIPRESGHEEHIIAYLQKFASDHNLECHTDKTGNVLIRKNASKGRESSPIVILQSHSDMVCEKNSGVEHDFAKDPIKTVIENGWLIAKDTTLGADCGIGIAAQLAVLEDNNLEHGPIECLFTTSEETGMDGAFGISNDFLKGSILVNLDSEDEGELFIGCAGGVDTTGYFKYHNIALRPGNKTFRIGFNGGLGGHSGDDIDKGRSNANQSLARALFRIMNSYETDLCSIDGGNKRNAISREACAILSVRPEDANGIMEILDKCTKELREEYEITDPGIGSYMEECEWNGEAIDRDTYRQLVLCLNSMPHGVLAMSAEMKGLVETSTNLASVKMTEDGRIRIGTSQRSSIDSSRRHAAEKVESALKAAGAEATHESEYPGWKPKLSSPILHITRESYKKLFGNEPIVRAIHAGLECGLFLTKYPHLDMISFGPTIRGVHAPGERLELSTVEKFARLLEDVLIQCK